MLYWDEKMGTHRETLETFLEPGETYESIVFGGKKHKWVPCTHNGVNSRGTQHSCKFVSPYRRFSHEVSARTGVTRFPDGWAQKVTKELERRRDVEENTIHL